MHLEFDSQFGVGDIVTLKAMAELNSSRCQAFRVEAILYAWETESSDTVHYKLRPIDPPRRWSTGAMATSTDRYVFGGYGLLESELCSLPEETRQYYAMTSLMGTEEEKQQAPKSKT